MCFSGCDLYYIARRIVRTEEGEKLPLADMCQLRKRLIQYKEKGSHKQIVKLSLSYSSVLKLDLVKYRVQVHFCDRLVMPIRISKLLALCANRQNTNSRQLTTCSLQHSISQRMWKRLH